MPPMDNQKREDKETSSSIPTPPTPPPDISTIPPIKSFEKPKVEGPVAHEESQEIPPITPKAQPQFEPMSLEEPASEPAPIPSQVPMEPQDFSQFQQPKFQQPSFLQAVSGREEIERIEELAESIIREKWDDLLRDMGDVSLWKEGIKTEISSIKQELVRTQERFENLQKAILGKVKDYDKNTRDLGSEMKALQKVFEKILSPLSSNIKELSKITKELKSKR